MADRNCSSESCLVHREVIIRIECLEKDIHELQDNLKDKVDTQILNQTLRQLDEMKNQIGKLSEADIKHSEAVAGISATLAEFKDIHREMKNDYNKLSDAYVSTSNSISELIGVLKGQAESKKTSGSNEDDIKFPWYIKMLKLKPVTYIAIVVLIFIFGIVIFNWSDIVEILKLLAV